MPYHLAKSPYLIILYAAAIEGVTAYSNPKGDYIT